VTPAIVDYISKVARANRVAVLLDNGQQSREMAELFKRLFPAGASELVAMQEYQIGQTDVTAQLLSLRKANPDLLFISGVSGTDLARVIKAQDDLGWRVPVAGSSSLSFLYREVANTLAASGSVKLLDGVSAQSFKALLYCPADEVGASPYAQFLKRLEAFNPDAMKRVAPVNVASGYDAVYLYKAAIEGDGGKTDGATITRWIENNGSAVTTVTIGRYSPSRTKHSMFGPESLAMGEKFDQPRADGLVKRAGC
jgi:ABC-type branched-subunit amino acid transport system substrate-binding protein